MNNLHEVISPHRPDPFSPEITANTRETGENLNAAADRVALLNTPPNLLPNGAAKIRAELDEIEATRIKKEQKLNEWHHGYNAWQALLSEIAVRQQRLAGNEARVFNARAEIERASSNVKYALFNEKNAGFQAVIHLLSSLAIAREIVAIFPALNEQERKSIEALQAKAGAMAKAFN